MSSRNVIPSSLRPLPNSRSSRMTSWSSRFFESSSTVDGTRGSSGSMAAINASRFSLQLEQFAQPPGLHARHRDFGVLFVVHAELVARLEPGDDLFDPVDVHQV